MIFPIYRIPYDSRGASVFFFGDLQYGAEGFDLEAWEAFRSEFKATPNAYAIGLGDYEDWLRPTIRARVQGATTGDSSARQQLDSKVRKEQDEVLDLMSFLEGRLVGLHEGHHDWEFMSGENSTSRIASALRTQNLGWMAGTRLILEPNRHAGAGGGYAYTVLSTHGNANGRKVSSAGMWMENNMVAGRVYNQYVMGHGCKSSNFVPYEIKIARRRGHGGEETVLPRCLVVGGFHKGFTNGFYSVTVKDDIKKAKTYEMPKTSYVERAGFQPQPIMWGVIRFKIVKTIGKNLSKGLSGNKVRDRRGCVMCSPTLDVEQVNRGPSGTVDYSISD